MTIDGRELRLPPQWFDTIWMLASFVPGALHAGGFTLRPLPSLVGLPRLLGHTPAILAANIKRMIGKTAVAGLRDLDNLERRLARLPFDIPVTKRSKAPLLVQLEMAYPGLRLPAVARLLGISHQGATKLMRQVQEYLNITTGIPKLEATFADFQSQC